MYYLSIAAISGFIVTLMRLKITSKYLLLAAEFWFGKRKPDEPNNQYFLLQAGNVPVPKQFTSASEIDRLSIVKTSEVARSYERAFFLS